MRVTQEIASKVAILDCRTHLPFPENRGEYHHGYYQAIRDVLNVLDEYEKEIRTDNT